MKNRVRSFSVFSALVLTLTVSFANAQDRLIITPRDGHEPFLTSIDGAKSKLDLVMFHLSDKDVIEALKRAQTRGVKVRAILDREIAGKSKASPVTIAGLQSAGVNVQLSSAGFSITHEKSMLVDGKTLFITSINLTTVVAKTRDFGVITADADLVSEYGNFFEADWKNAQAGTVVSPPSKTRLVWSPNTSQDRLIEFIGSAKKSVLIEIENLGSAEMQIALVQAAKNGIDVKVMVSECGMGAEPKRNEPYLDELIQGGVSVLVMTGASTSLKPYIHAKVIVVDGKQFFVGSENFSFNSLIKAREVGILSDDAAMVKEVTKTMQSDFALGSLRKVGQSASCSASF